MLFLLKRDVFTSLAALLVLAAAGIVLRFSRGDAATPLHVNPWLPLLGVVVVLCVLVSDGVIHGSLLVLFGDAYRQRHHELAALFRGQSLSAIVTGSLMASVGEELVFRGLGTDLVYLFPAAVLFGVLHHIRGSLWHVTVWSVWQGFLFAIALHLTGELLVTMTAHFLHDCIGFLIFRRLNRMRQEAQTG
jgi:membrane protease YdiL (CAAX protease family)